MRRFHKRTVSPINMNESKVVAISGVSGCGKTSVVTQLSKVFSCPSLLFDEHTDLDSFPNDMKLWFKNGANASMIKTPRLVTALRELKVLSNNEFIFLEEPLGRCRAPISSLIDYVILLDMPMVVCLSRLVMRNIQNPNIDSSNSLPKYLSMYDEFFRELYIESANQVRDDSDLIIKEVTSIDFTTKTITNWLKGCTNKSIQ